MKADDRGTVTQLLGAARRGEAGATDRLWGILYDELKQLAHGQLVNEPHAAPKTTSLVHQAFIRMTDGQRVHFENRRHFFGAAIEIMRRIRVDDARKRDAQKRGGGAQPVRLCEQVIGSNQDSTELLSVNETLEKLAKQDPRKAEIVKARYFAGLTEEETAAELGISRRTVQLEWRIAKAWLHRELSRGDTSTG
jgi:RNA polymerase sigma factor (TIGR02999 family)